MGTRYIRDSDPLPTEITLDVGEEYYVKIPNIYSELEIGSKLEIWMEEMNGLNDLVESGWGNTALRIFASGEGKFEGGTSFDVILDSYNKLEETEGYVEATLKVDTIKVNINCRCHFAYH